MKTILTLAMAMAVSMAAYGQPYVWNSTNTVNGAIPDNNPSGVASAINVSGLGAGILNVTVSLDISGGYNGDLYAYLAGPNGGFAVLLNRSGVNGGNAFGYSDAGFDVTFDDSGANNGVHFYQNDSPTITGGQLTGTWASDGETVNPQASPSSFNSGSGSATLASFDNLNGNGQWTLFLADLSGGNQSTLNNWTLDITTVPEPSSLAWGALGLGLIGMRKTGRKKFF